MKYIKIKDEDLCKSIIELSIEKGVGVDVICLMAYLQKTWIRCANIGIHSDSLGNEDWITEQVIKFFPQFKNALLRKKYFENRLFINDTLRDAKEYEASRYGNSYGC